MGVDLTNISSEEGGHHLRNRQSGACDNQCFWVAEAQSCIDSTCDCQVVRAAGSEAIVSCSTCLRPLNATLAKEAFLIGQACGVNLDAVPVDDQPATEAHPNLEVLRTVTTIITSIIVSSVSSLSRSTVTPAIVIPSVSISGSATISGSSTTTQDLGDSHPVQTFVFPTISGSTSSQNTTRHAAIGGIVGAVAGILVVALAGFALWRRRQTINRGKEVIEPIHVPPAPTVLRPSIVMRGGVSAGAV